MDMSFSCVVYMIEYFINMNSNRIYSLLPHSTAAYAAADIYVGSANGIKKFSKNYSGEYYGAMLLDASDNKNFQANLSGQFIVDQYGVSCLNF